MSKIFQSICTMLHGIESYHDTITKEHECRTGDMMRLLAKEMVLEDSVCNALRDVGSIHDIGKIAIPGEILQKQGPLTTFERKVVELHPVIGFDFIKNIRHPNSELAAKVILTHHENHDGTGYPYGLSGNEIPLEGAICAICDVYDALRKSRPYRGEMLHEAIFEKMYGTGPDGLYYKFNPDLMAAFKNISNKIQALYTQ